MIGLKQTEPNLDSLNTPKSNKVFTKTFSKFSKYTLIAILLCILISLIPTANNTRNNTKLSREMLDNINITNAHDLTFPNTQENIELVLEKLKDDNWNILFKRLYEDIESDEIVLEAAFDYEELNSLMSSIDTVEKFNLLIANYIFDSSPIYSNPIVNSSWKINCYGYTLLAMSFIDTHLDYKFYYEVIQDHSQPHVYLKVYNKNDQTYEGKVDLTIQDKLELTQ